MIDFDCISDAVKGLTNEKRFLHTQGVEKEALKLAMIFIPQKAEKLRLAGILHDITKNFTTEKHLQLCEKYGISVDVNNLVPKLLHSKTGCEYARRLFGDELVDNEVYNGIYYHTTGRKNMTLFEAIIYLADYIEEGRTFEDCVYLRNYFYSELEKQEDKLEVLRKTMVLSFDLTIAGLIKEGKPIDSDTIDARNYFLKSQCVIN